jgi:hypothetical protein
MAYKTMASDGNAFADKTMTLNSGVVAYPYPTLYFGKWPYKTIMAEGASI